MELETIAGGIVGALGAAYFTADYFLGKYIARETDQLITHSATIATQGRPLQLSARETHRIMGWSSHKAMRRYERVYANLIQQKGNPNFKQIMELLREE